MIAFVVHCEGATMPLLIRARTMGDACAMAEEMFKSVYIMSIRVVSFKDDHLNMDLNV